jgi:4-amino-4-deoxy-L-arabinose transferase-like glycosyltransferase
VERKTKIGLFPFLLMPKPAYLLLLFVFGLLLCSLGNASLPLIDRDEPRFAEASREMWQSGDYIIPRINGDYRFDKPPLIYWCQVAAFRILGDNDFAARLPSVVFAALTAVVTALWGTRLFGWKIGLRSGLVFVSSLQVFIHARAAVADMPMVFFFLTASWADWERQRKKTPFLWSVYYLSLGLGFLAKGPVALLPILFSPLHALWVHHRFRPNLRSSFSGLILVLLIVGSWGVPALIATNGEFFAVGIGKHVVGRSLIAMEHHGGSGWLGYVLFLPFFLVTVFLSFFPWSIFIPRIVARLRSKMDDDESYLLIGVIVVFVVFTFVQTKLPHYTLPCFPMLSILAVRSMGKMFRPMLVTVTLVYVVIALAGFRAVEPFFLSKTIALQALPEIKSETRTASLNYDEQSLIWYLRAKTHPFHLRLDSADFARFMQEPGPAICVVNEESIKKIIVDPAWHSFTVSGYNFARWKTRPQKVFGLRIAVPVPQSLTLVALIKD